MQQTDVGTPDAGPSPEPNISVFFFGPETSPVHYAADRLRNLEQRLAPCAPEELALATFRHWTRIAQPRLDLAWPAGGRIQIGPRRAAAHGGAPALPYPRWLLRAEKVGASATTGVGGSVSTAGGGGGGIPSCAADTVVAAPRPPGRSGRPARALAEGGGCADSAARRSRHRKLLTRALA